MTLYHATKDKNIEDILNFGLVATEGMDNVLDNIGVYGFLDLQDAIDFGFEMGIENNFSVFMFDASDAEKDPEYDNGAYVVHHNIPDVELIDKTW